MGVSLGSGKPRDFHLLKSAGKSQNISSSDSFPLKQEGDKNGRRESPVMSANLASHMDHPKWPRIHACGGKAFAAPRCQEWKGLIIRRDQSTGSSTGVSTTAFWFPYLGSWTWLKKQLLSGDVVEKSSGCGVPVFHL